MHCGYGSCVEKYRFAWNSSVTRSVLILVPMFIVQLVSIAMVGRVYNMHICRNTVQANPIIVMDNLVLIFIMETNI